WREHRPAGLAPERCGGGGRAGALYRSFTCGWVGGGGGRGRKAVRGLGVGGRGRGVLLGGGKGGGGGWPPGFCWESIESLSLPEALGAALSGINQLIRIIEQPLDPAVLKQQRLIGEMSLGAGRLYMSAAEGEF